MTSATASASDPNAVQRHVVWKIKDLAPFVYRQRPLRPSEKFLAVNYLRFKSDGKWLGRFSCKLYWIDDDYKASHDYFVSVLLVDKGQVIWRGEHDVPASGDPYQSIRFSLGYIPKSITLVFTVRVSRNSGFNPTMWSGLISPLLGSAMLSDVTLACGDREFACHKVLLACRSGFFRTMFTGQFKEASEKRITIGGVGPGTLELLLKFIYTDEIEESDVSWDLFEAARMYDVTKLDSVCAIILRKCLDVGNCCQMLEASCAHDMDDLFNAAFNLVQMNKEQLAGTPEFNRLMTNEELRKRVRLPFFCDDDLKMHN